MKRFLIIALLIATEVQAYDLKKAWNMFGKDNKHIYMGKALAASVLGYVATRGALEQLIFDVNVYQNRMRKAGYREPVSNKEALSGMESTKYGGDHDWVGTYRAEMIPRHFLMAGIAAYAAYECFNQAWHDAKRAYDMHKKKSKK